MLSCRVIREKSKLSTDFTVEKPALTQNNLAESFDFLKIIPQKYLPFPLYNSRKVLKFKLCARTSPRSHEKIFSYFVTFIRGLLVVENKKKIPKNLILQSLYVGWVVPRCLLFSWQLMSCISSYILHPHTVHLHVYMHICTY
jgi:hypothetical protein